MKNKLFLLFMVLCCNNSIAFADNSIEEIFLAETKEGRLQDSLALIEFYTKTGGENWTQTWDLTQPMDTWFGVRLDGRGRVLCLDLDGEPNCGPQKAAGNNLTGTLPDVSLPCLEHLFLSGNKFVGEIPDLQGLPNLLTLQLCCNHFTGEVPNFSQLPRLNSLELDYNELTGRIPHFSKMPELENLYLSNNQFTGAVPNLRHLTQLKRIYLHQNQLAGRLPTLQNTELMELLLFNNQLDGKISSFKHLTNLQFLNVSNNNFSGPLPELNHIERLVDVDFSNNQLQGAIPDLTNKPYLRNLLLANNQFSEKGKAENLPALQTLSLANNQLTFSDLQAYKNWLTEVSFYENQRIAQRDTLLHVELDFSAELVLYFDQNSSSNQYEWYRDGVLITDIANERSLHLEQLIEDDLTKYYCKITNSDFPGLTVESRQFILKEAVQEPVVVPVAFADEFKFAPQSRYPLDLVANDHLEDIENWDIQLLSAPQIGKLTETAAGVFELQTPPGFTGQLSFHYEICNLLEADACDKGVVTIEIEASEEEVAVRLPARFAPSYEGTYVIPALNEAPLDFPSNQLAIFDQRGSLVYSSKNYQNDWQGLNQQNNQPLPTGVYFYQFIWQKGKEQGQKTGYIVILR